MRVYGRPRTVKTQEEEEKSAYDDRSLRLYDARKPEVVEKLETSYRYVDIIFGTHNIFKFAELIRGHGLNHNVW